MKPFSISDHSLKMRSCYPPSEAVRSLLRSSDKREVVYFLRLWVSEGIPYAFRETPMLYEAIREYIGVNLSIHAKAITIIGSARLGYSLSSGVEFGRNYRDESDLDLSIIEADLFLKLKTDFECWKEDYQNCVVQPRNPNERRYWPDNLARLPGNIENGFIDPYKIPLLRRYRAVQTVMQTKYSTQEKLKMTPDAPRFSNISFRIYRDYEAFMRQMEMNICFTRRSLLPHI